MSRRGCVPSLPELVETMQRMEREVLQAAQPKPWIVDVSQQHRPKRATNHRRIK